MCRKCKHLLPENAFAPAAWRNDVTPQCRTCAAAYVKAHRGPRLEWAQDYKIANGCVDCRYTGDPTKLEFDHIVPGNPNKFGGRENLAQAIRGTRATWWKVVDELIHDCEVRCKPCHAIRSGHQQTERSMNGSAYLSDESNHIPRGTTRSQQSFFAVSAVT